MESTRHNFILLILAFVLLSKGQVDGGSKMDIKKEVSDRSEGDAEHVTSTKEKFSAIYQASAPSYYGYPRYPPLHPYNYYPYLGEQPYYERNGRDFSVRASHDMPSANYGYSSSDGSNPEYTDQVMSPSHSHSHHGHGHGHGWSKVDTSALGLFGLIGLLSLLQNVLRSLTTTTTTTMMTMMMGRKKRASRGPEQDEELERVNAISLLVLPALNIVGHARNGKIPLECTRREICKVNELLVQELGPQGFGVGSMMSVGIMKLLKGVEKKGEMDKLSLAAQAGRDGAKCEILYPLCHTMQHHGGSLPLLMTPTHFNKLGLSSPVPKSAKENALN